jgi:hypothetical protein
MKLFQVTVQVDVIAPFVIAGNDRAVWGLDVSQIRNSAGQAIIPDTHIKGVLRHALVKKHENSDMADALFGRHIPDRDEKTPARPSDLEITFQTEKSGAMQFEDLVATPLDASLQLDVPRITRVSIDDETGTARKGHLLISESGAAPGKTVIFKGAALLWAADKDEAATRIQSLNEAAELVSAIGRFKTVGWGETAKISLDLCAEVLPYAADKAEKLLKDLKNGPLTLSFTPDRPFVVNARYSDSNTLEGDSIIPGGVIKGALAAHLKSRGVPISQDSFKKTLARLRIEHALPMQGDTELVGRDPQDLVRWGPKDQRGKSAWFKAAEPNYNDAAGLPNFPIDEKSDETVVDLCEREVRTRVAIDETKQAAKKSALFTQSMVRPTKGGRPVTWQSQLSLPAQRADIDDAALLQILQALAEGPTSLGKTHARMTHVSLVKSTAPSALEPAERDADRIRIVLRTPALMVRERHLGPAPMAPSGDCGAGYANALALYWKMATNGAWQIARDTYLGVPDMPAFFVRLQFRGGFEARAHRFFGKDILEPFVLTEAGSVFYLERTGTGDAVAALEQLMSNGLPAARWGDTEPTAVGPDDWAECPFVPQNGYGDIQIEAPK